MTGEETAAETGSVAPPHPGKPMGPAPRPAGQTHLRRAPWPGCRPEAHTPLTWNFPQRGKAVTCSPARSGTSHRDPTAPRAGSGPRSRVTNKRAKAPPLGGDTDGPRECVRRDGRHPNCLGGSRTPEHSVWIHLGHFNRNESLGHYSPLSE